ncbi:helix-turn-helix transcriptional regulator [Demequina sp. SO4-13]|uniref:helix-turn-helix transcriptional regulator n=1 Tax=Demequina sp. SO4-13 TaxID=3401027 RepID=UPI003AF9A434
MSEISAEQRRLNLMLALSATRRRLTREEIRARVDGYEPAPRGASAEERDRADVSFQRMFERDKDELRPMGLPLRTVTDPLHQDDLGYRIDGDASLPDLDLTVQDAAILALAVEYWQGASLAEDARMGYAKVVSAIEHGDSDALPYGGMSTSAGHDATAALAEAIVDRQAVRFDYASASSETARRTVQPWGIVMRSGVEYLVGFDLDRKAQRTFRVGRIAGRVRTTGDIEAFERPATLPLGDLDDNAATLPAVIALRPETGHGLRRRGEPVVGDSVDPAAADGWDLVRVPYRHEDLLRSEILSLHGAARVVEPESLRESVLAHARAAVEVARG